MRVAFLGPAGTFAEEALRASAPRRSREQLEEVPYPTIFEAVMAVQHGAVDRAVVPIENSLEGGVAATLDALAGDADGVRIVGETVQEVHHHLIARRPIELDAVRRVLSHPHALGQCSRYLRDRMPGAEAVAASSTAEAVRSVVEDAATDGASAAIGTALAAELYGATVLAERIEDRSDNVTRFVWLAHTADAVAPTGAGAKTSIVFWGFNDDAPGSLVSVLRELSDRAINLTKIESRPRRVRLGHYMFFADLDASASDPAVEEALAALAARVETLRVLGSYPADASEAA